MILTVNSDYFLKHH